MENRKKQNLCLTLGGMIVILAGILVTILGYKLNRDGEITAKDTAVFVGYFLVRFRRWSVLFYEKLETNVLQSFKFLKIWRNALTFFYGRRKV